MTELEPIDRTNDRITTLFILFSRQTFLIKGATKLHFLHYSRVVIIFPVDTGRKLNVHKTFRRLPGRLMYV